MTRGIWPERQYIEAARRARAEAATMAMCSEARQRRISYAGYCTAAAEAVARGDTTAAYAAHRGVMDRAAASVYEGTRYWDMMRAAA